MAAEISIIGDFDLNPPIKIPAEIAMIQQGTWAPGSADFTGVVSRGGGRAQQVSSFADFLGVIANSPKQSIKQINVFTHADNPPPMIAFGGYIDSNAVGSAGVYFNPVNPGQSLVQLDASALTFLNNGGTFGPQHNPNQFTLSSVKDKFMPGALIIFFACHTGSDPTLLQGVASTFGVRVIGFTSAIAYCPIYNLNPPPSIDRAMDIALGSCAARHMTNFHQFSMVASPTGSQIVVRVP